MRIKFKKTTAVLISLLVPAYVATFADRVLAYGVGTSTMDLPWEAPLSNLASELTGPTAGTIAIIAIFVAGLALVFGEDLGKFARTLLMIVIAVAFLVGAAHFVTPLTTGAVL